MIVPHHGYCGGQYNQDDDIHNINDRSLSTGHANGARDMISRLETMVLGGADLPVPVVRQQIASALDVIVHLSRFRDRTRRVTEICEVIGCRDGEVELSPLFKFEERGEMNGFVQGGLVRVNRLKRTDKLQFAGFGEEAAGCPITGSTG